jgi:zinc protease
MRDARRASLALTLALGAVACATGSRPAWELPAPPPVEAPVVQQGSLHRATLENGLEILVLEDERLPRVGLGLTFRRGEAMVAPEQAGLASFTAAMLERGAGDRDALAFAEAIDALGASFGAAAGWDTLNASAAGLSRDLDFLLGVVADAVLAPRFDAAEAERVRSELLASLERAKDDPSTLANWYAAKALYAGHRYGTPVSGSAETVAALRLDAVKAFHREVLVPNNAIFYATGDVDAAALIAEVKQRFGGWAAGDVPAPGPPPPTLAPEARKIVVVDRPELVQARIVVTHEGIARSDEDRIPTSLMNSVVGGSGFSSRLMTTLRSEEGLTYGVYSGYALRRATGPFVVQTFTEVSSVRPALDLLLAELERGRAEPPGEGELAWARTLAIGRFSMGLETSDAVVSSLVDLDVHGLPRDSLDTYRRRVRAVTPEAVAQAADDHLHPDRTAIVLVGPAETIVPAVEDLGPVEVVTP